MDGQVKLKKLLISFCSGGAHESSRYGVTPTPDSLAWLEDAYILAGWALPHDLRKRLIGGPLGHVSALVNACSASVHVQQSAFIMAHKATDTRELAPGVRMPIIGFGVCEPASVLSFPMRSSTAHLLYAQGTHRKECARSHALKPSRSDTVISILQCITTMSKFAEEVLDKHSDMGTCWPMPVRSFLRILSVQCHVKSNAHMRFHVAGMKSAMLSRILGSIEASSS